MLKRVSDRKIAQAMAKHWSAYKKRQKMFGPKQKPESDEKTEKK